jgi:hypothetical protein
VVRWSICPKFENLENKFIVSIVFRFAGATEYMLFAHKYGTRKYERSHPMITHSRIKK